MNTLAFPRPGCEKAFYDRTLVRREDLVWLKTDEGEDIPACHIVGRPRRGRKTLLYSHGNAEDLGLHLPYIDALARQVDADVFSYEYVGYSLGRWKNQEPSEAGCLRSIDAAWKYCTDTKGIPPEDIVIFGRSIGSGPSVDLASREEVLGSQHSPLNAAGVLLQSPIESGGTVAFGSAMSWLAYRLDIFRNYEKIGKIRAPVAIIHGTADEVVNISNGKNLHAKLKQPYQPKWLEGYGHNDMPEDACFEYARQFLRSLESR